MRAIQIKKIRDIGVVDVPEPILEDNYAEIDVKAMGICGSDVHAYAGKSPNVTYPVIIGHEIAGVVTRIAENSDNINHIKVGDRVVLNPYLYCGKCYPCSKGRTNCCESLKCLGCQTDGAMRDRFTHPTNLMIKVPESLDWETSAVIEPAVIALHAIHTVDLKRGEHIVINGAGCIGMLIAILAVAKGGIPIMVDIVDDRLALSKKYGVKYTVNSRTGDAVSAIKEITNGRMAECVCEVSGNTIGIRNTLDFAAATGRIALTGWPDREVLLPTAVITRRELTIRGSRTGISSEFEEVMNMVSNGQINIRQIISKKVKFEEIPQAVRELDEHPERDLKVIGLNL